MVRSVGLALLLALAGGPAYAQDAQAPGAGDAEPGAEALDDVPGVEGEESPELRALRLAEIEMFGRDALVELVPRIPHPVRLSVPVALTSDAPALEPAAGASGTARDLSWLAGLTLPDIPVRWDDRVLRYLEYYRDDPRGQSIIRAWMRRVERFGPTIRRTLREEGLPEDLIYLAMIESGFDPRARSEAGAIGLWQFVSRTGTEYGLRQDHWVDMRMDPEASTRAAARYLASLERRLGTWELAFAAYNAGYGTLLRAIRKYDTNDYWELSHLEAALPFETTLYVSKITAAAIVGRNLERFGLSGLSREAPTEFDTVEVPGGTGLPLLARAAGTSVEEMHRLNPALRRDRVPPAEASFPVRIPAGRRDSFARHWEHLRPRDPVHRSYVARFGEDLASIAHRFRTTEPALRRLNELSDGDRIGPGFALVVPAVTPAEPARGEAPVVAIPPGTFEYVDRRRVFYRVARRDRLDEIAGFFAVTLEELRQWNAVDPRAELQEGMFLQLFVPPSVDLGRAVVLGPDEVRTLVIGSEEFYRWHVEQEGRVRFRYAVRAGDTLSQIAERFGLPTASMARINQIGRDATLRIGQELVVYTTPDRVPAGLRAEPVSAEDAETAPAEAAAAEPQPAETAAASTAAADVPTPSPAAPAPSPAAPGAEIAPATAPETPPAS